jgi:hypothetical protein
MRKFSVDIQTGAFATITVELSDERLQEIADELDTTVDELTIKDLREFIEEVPWPTPQICAQCGGWGQKYSMEIGEVWDLSDSPDAVREKED